MILAIANNISQVLIYFSKMTKLFKLSKPYKKEWLKVSPLHNIYIEQYGNPKGIPLVHIHGGPGSKSKPKHAKYYNPKKFRIILYDQRGCGKSTPMGETRQNSTQELVADLEKIRRHLEIDKWVVSGGSWGSTLALAYAETYPKKVKYLLVRGVFTARKWEFEWVEKFGGASSFFPEEWEKYESFIPKAERGNLINAYAKRILAGDKKAGKIATGWEASLLTLIPNKKEEEFTDEDFAGSKIFYHYEKKLAFLKEGELLKNAKKLKNIPGVIIQGRYDMICPPITAWELHKAWPKSELVFVPDAGHHGDEKGIRSKIVEYTNKI